ncbi:MAG: hypothetical protein JXR25_09770 [Pontiellaceae bacterium]|nr:hypothetical protein [Pontiellaceae bacterium]MBN2785104.1 hypothetical protein [Pontiellaceae bacterium]
MNKNVLSILFGLTVCVQIAVAFDVKGTLGIDEISLDSLDVGAVISDSSIITNDPAICSAATYILYGSAQGVSSAPESKLIKYDDRKVSEDTIRAAKKFLMTTAAFHQNTSTRAMACMTIAFAFPNDKKVSEWMYERYFFTEISEESGSAILGIIRTGNFTTPEADLIVKAGLMGLRASLVVNAASCVKKNPDHYRSFVPDLVASLLTLEKRNDAVDEFDNRTKLNVSYLFLTQALEQYKNDASHYVGCLERLEKASGDNAVRLLVLKMRNL